MLEVSGQVEDAARVYAAREHVLEKLGDVLTRGGDATLDADVLPEQRLVVELFVGRETDDADHAAGLGDADRRGYRFLGSDAFERSRDANPVGDPEDFCNGVVTALLDDVGRAELLGQRLPGGVAAEHDDARRAEFLGADDRAQADRSVADDRDDVPVLR